MDVIMPLSPESLQNRQALTALVSIRRFMPDARLIVCSRAKPDFLPEAVWVRSPDRYPNRDANQIEAILAAIQAGVTEEFLRCSDDEVLTSADPPPVHSGPIAIGEGGRWQRRLNRTARWLLAHGYPALDYDTHTPKVYDRDEFRRIMARSPWQGSRGLTIESTYFNQALHATAHC